MAIKANSAVQAQKTNASKAQNPLIAKLKAKASYTAGLSILKTIKGEDGLTLGRDASTKDYYAATAQNLAAALGSKYDPAKPAVDQVNSFAKHISNTLDLREPDTASSLQLASKRLIAKGYAENGKRAAKASSTGPRKMKFSLPGQNAKAA